jgi:hypothetical protein
MEVLRFGVLGLLRAGAVLGLWGSVRFEFEGSGARSRRAILVVKREEKDDALSILCGPHHDRDPGADDAGLPSVPLPTMSADLQ